MIEVGVAKQIANFRLHVAETNFPTTSSDAFFEYDQLVDRSARKETHVFKVEWINCNLLWLRELWFELNGELVNSDRLNH